MNANDRPVKGPDGRLGTVDTTCWPGLDEKPDSDVHLRLIDGRDILVPADALIEQCDGSYYLPRRREELQLPPEPHNEPTGANDEDEHWPCDPRGRRHG